MRIKVRDPPPQGEGPQSTGETADAVTFILTIKNQIVKTFSKRAADFLQTPKIAKHIAFLRDLDGRIC